MALIITPNMVKRKEFIVAGEVFRRVPNFPKYHISDRGIVVSNAVGSPKELKGRNYTTMAISNGYMRRMKNVDICVMAFNGK